MDYIKYFIIKVFTLIPSTSRSLIFLPLCSLSLGECALVTRRLQFDALPAVGFKLKRKAFQFLILVLFRMFLLTWLGTGGNHTHSRENGTNENGTDPR